MAGKVSIPFGEYYEFVIGEDDVPTVHSECCANEMSPGQAREIRDALSEWLACQEAGR